MEDVLICDRAGFLGRIFGLVSQASASISQGVGQFGPLQQASKIQCPYEHESLSSHSPMPRVDPKYCNVNMLTSLRVL